MIFTVLSCELIARGTYDMRLHTDPMPAASPGQFFHIRCGERLLRRPISICGMGDGIARIVFSVKGEGTRWLASRRTGDSLDVIGPFGNGFPSPGETPTLLIGGGVGLPPLLFAAKSTTARTHALLGFRDSEHVCLASEFPSYTVFTDDGSAGEAGYPHRQLSSFLTSGNFGQVFACGPHPLLAATAALCGEAGIPCFVSMEERMGCGVGACLVCACAVQGSYRRVCRDGPVFDAAEVDWNG